MDDAAVHRDRRLVPGRGRCRSRRDWLVDGLLFLLAVGFTALTLLDDLDRDLAPAPLAVDLAFGGLACLGLWLRRRVPVGFAVVVGLLSIYSMSASGVALIALFTVAVHRSFVVAGVTAAGYALFSLLTPLVRPDTQLPSWWQALLGVVCVAAVLAWGMFVRARRQLAASRHERIQRAQAEQELRLAQTRQHERNQIAGEMHDVLAHRLSLLSLHAGALELRPDAAPEDVARAAAVIRDNAHQALEDLREVIGVLRADQVSTEAAPERPQPTLADLPSLVEESRRAGMRVHLVYQVAETRTVPAGVGRTAYRIVQEGLTNARKHARDAEVSVSVHATAGDGLSIEIGNPWPQATADIPGGGAGLIGLAERARLTGGRLEHGRTDAGDFRLWAWLPWPA